MMHGYMVHGRGNSHKGEESNGSDVCRKLDEHTDNYRFGQ
jgi:hypothetical protein